MDFEVVQNHEQEEDEDEESLDSAKMPIDAPPLSSARRPRYRECLKNHAVGLGSHAVDGCGEFLPAGPEGTLDALKCAACNCHRNFHRKDTEPVAAASSAIVSFNPHHHRQHHEGHQFFPPPQHFSPYYGTPAGYLQQCALYDTSNSPGLSPINPHRHRHTYPLHHREVTPTNQRPLALPSTSGGAGGSHSRGEEMEDMSNPSSFGGGSGSSKKRYRTKFTQEQKDKMLAFAEALGWRIQRQDDEAVDKFCNETDLKRHVLKVWMHNNKHTLGKKP